MSRYREARQMNEFFAVCSRCNVTVQYSGTENGQAA